MTEPQMTLLLTILSVGIALVAAIAGVIAALYAVRLWRAGQRDLEPRPRISFIDTGGGLQAQIGNPGGAALSVWVLAFKSNTAYVWGGNLAEHIAPLLSFTFTELGPAPMPPTGSVRMVVSTAMDSDRRAWDCLKGKRIRGSWEKRANGELKRLGMSGYQFRRPGNGEMNLLKTTTTAQPASELGL